MQFLTIGLSLSQTHSKCCLNKVKLYLWYWRSDIAVELCFKVNAPLDEGWRIIIIQESNDEKIIQ